MNKTCKTCGETKEIDRFQKSTTYKDRRETTCKACRKKRKKEMDQADPRRIKKRSEFQRRCKAKRPEHYRERNREHRRRYYKKHKDRIREQAKIWQKKNPERMRELRRLYRLRNRDKIRKCHKAWYTPQRGKRNTLLANYGITLEAFRDVLRQQKGKCLICKSQVKEVDKRNYATVDHCHRTGNVRALLCLNCNAGLGHFKDNPTSIIRAFVYLVESAGNKGKTGVIKWPVWP